MGKLNALVAFAGKKRKAESSLPRRPEKNSLATKRMSMAQQCAAIEAGAAARAARGRKLASGGMAVIDEDAREGQAPPIVSSLAKQPSKSTRSGSAPPPLTPRKSQMKRRRSWAHQKRTSPSSSGPTSASWAWARRRRQRAAMRRSRSPDMLQRTYNGRPLPCAGMQLGVCDA